MYEKPSDKSCPSANKQRRWYLGACVLANIDRDLLMRADVQDPIVSDRARVCLEDDQNVREANV